MIQTDSAERLWGTQQRVLVSETARLRGGHAFLFSKFCIFAAFAYHRCTFFVGMKLIPPLRRALHCLRCACTADACVERRTWSGSLDPRVSSTRRLYIAQCSIPWYLLCFCACGCYSGCAVPERSASHSLPLPSRCINIRELARNSYTWLISCPKELHFF